MTRMLDRTVLQTSKKTSIIYLEALRMTCRRWSNRLHGKSDARPFSRSQHGSKHEQKRGAWGEASGCSWPKKGQTISPSSLRRRSAARSGAAKEKASI